MKKLLAFGLALGLALAAGMYFWSGSAEAPADASVGAPAGGSRAFCSAGLRGGGGRRKRKAARSRRGPR